MDPEFYADLSVDAAWYREARAVMDKYRQQCLMGAWLLVSLPVTVPVERDIDDRTGKVI
jgi:hypothetical protein